MKLQSSLLVTLLGLLALPSLSQAASVDANLFISEYVEGSGNNQAIEIYNAGDDAVDLAGCRIDIFFDGIDQGDSAVFLSGSLAAGEVLVIANAQGDTALKNSADLLAGNLSFNGDDAVALICDTPNDPEPGTTEVFLDSLGRAREQRVWGQGEVTTQNKTLRRKFSVTIGDRDPRDDFDPALEWDAFPVDSFDGLGSAPTPPSPAPLTGSFGLFALGTGLLMLRRR